MKEIVETEAANESRPPVHRGITHVHRFLLIGAEDFEGGKTLHAILPSDAFMVIAIDGTKPYSALNHNAEQGWASVTSAGRAWIKLDDCTDV